MSYDRTETDRTETPPVSLDEIRRILGRMPGPDLEAAAAVAERERSLTKPAGALGRLESIVDWMARWQGRASPRADRARVCVFAGNHGVAARGVSAYPAAVTAQMVRNFVNGGAAINHLCGAIDADLRVFELDLDSPTGDFCEGPAMDDASCARAISYGMMAVEPGLDLLCLGEMGIGNTTTAAALSMALFGGAATDWVGPGTGIAGDALRAKTDAAARACDLHRDAIAGGDALEALRCVGGLELAAIVGAAIAARMARTPVLLDGFVCTAAAAVIDRLRPGGLDHCMIGHLSPEPGHARLAERLGKQPILTLGMRLGEASGATLAAGIVKAAVACHAGMATFSDAGVSGKTD